MSGLQVLLMSADPERAHSLADALRAAGHTVEIQSGSPLGGQSALGAGVHAVLVDLDLPWLDRAALGHLLAPGVPQGAPEPLEAVEKRQIHAMLLYTGGNKRRAAQLLGIARSTLIQKVRRYGIEVAGRGR